MIRYVLFNQKGSVKKGSKLDYPRLGKDQHLLLFLSKPSKEEINRVSSDFKFDKKPLMTLSKESHSRRYMTVPFQFIMRAFYLEKNRIEFSNLLFVLTKKCLIVVASKESDFYDDIVNNLFEEFRKSRVRSTSHLLGNFLQEDVEENYEVLGLIEKRIKNIEFAAAEFEKESKVEVDDIMYLKAQLYRLSRQFWSTTRVISLIRMGVTQMRIEPASIRLLGDIHETFLHQIDVAAAQKEMLSDALTIYSTSISNKLTTTSNALNQVMRNLAAYGLILLVPTLISGIYGMNFRVIPFAAEPWGFLGVIGLMVGLMIIIFAYAKKSNWL
jgi:magnesium transporter